MDRDQKPEALQTTSPESSKEQTTTAPSTASQVVTLPAGSKVLMALQSPLHTTSGVEGSGIYLETVFPVVQENHVVIPVRTQVLGVVDAEKRPGRVKGRAQFRFHFTSLVFANNYVTPIDGALQSLPGNAKVRTQDAEGTIEPVDQIDPDVAALAEGAAGGFVIGSVRGGRIKATGYSAIGAGIGAGVALGKILFTRGDEIHLASGTLIEMVLSHPISIELQHVPVDAESQSRYAPPEESRALRPLDNNDSSSPPPQRRRPRPRPWPFPWQLLGW